MSVSPTGAGRFFFVIFCYHSIGEFQAFPVPSRRFPSKVGTDTLSSAQKLDKSGKGVYTRASFPIGNKSYKLFPLLQITDGKR